MGSDSRIGASTYQYVASGNLYLSRINEEPTARHLCTSNLDVDATFKTHSKVIIYHYGVSFSIDQSQHVYIEHATVSLC